MNVIPGKPAQDTLPPPNQFQLEKPPCIRAALMEHVVGEIRSDFMKNMGGIIDEFIMAPYRTTLQNAQELEKQGQIEGASLLYEKLVDACFTASMPYDRLRIIYTKQKQFDKALAVCESFIATLKMLQSFQARPQHVRQIEDCKIQIEKMKLKTGKTVDGKVVS
jgi:hypothetical protein